MPSFFLISVVIKGKVANFGRVPYGQTLVGMVHMATPNTACKSLSSIVVPDDEKTPASGTSPIVVVKFGACLPITKIKYAQAAGAKMVIYIVDSSAEDLEKNKPVGRGHSIPTNSTASAYLRRPACEDLDPDCHDIQGRRRDSRGIPELRKGHSQAGVVLCEIQHGLTLLLLLF